MWAVAINDARLFDILTDELKKEFGFEIVVTGTGAKVARAPSSKPPSEQKPHFFLVDQGLEHTKNAISWVYKNLHPEALISSGLCEDWRADIGDSSHEPFFVPALCLRSAGRIDMGGGPILFEEIGFDQWIQNSLLKQALPEVRELASHNRIFGSDRALIKEAEKKWLSGQVQCQTFDTFSGELLLAGKRLGLKIGCLKIFSGGPQSFDSALSLLLRLCVAL